MYQKKKQQKKLQIEFPFSILSLSLSFFPFLFVLHLFSSPLPLPFLPPANLPSLLLALDAHLLSPTGLFFSFILLSFLHTSLTFFLSISLTQMD
jgi:hypothetical protein